MSNRKQEVLESKIRRKETELQRAYYIADKNKKWAEKEFRKFEAKAKQLEMDVKKFEETMAECRRRADDQGYPYLFKEDSK